MSVSKVQPDSSDQSRAPKIDSMGRPKPVFRGDGRQHLELIGLHQDGGLHPVGCARAGLHQLQRRLARQAGDQLLVAAVFEFEQAEATALETIVTAGDPTNG